MTKKDTGRKSQGNKSRSRKGGGNKQRGKKSESGKGRSKDRSSQKSGRGGRPGGSTAGGSGRSKGKGKVRGRAPTRSGAQGASKGLGGDQVEGVHAVRELLIAGRRKVREVVIDDGAAERAVIGDIVELAAAARVPVHEVPSSKLRERARTEAPQGVLAEAKSLTETDLADLVGTSGAGGAAPFLLAFDGVTDPGNLGAALRSAEGAGVSGVLLPRHRSVRITPTVAKAAAGAIEYLPFAVVGGIPAALDELKRHGIWVVGLDEVGDGTIHDLTVADEPVCLVVGAEGAGLGRLTRSRCDLVTRIPLHGNVPSLNVSVAAALACFEIRRRRGG